MTYAQSFFTVTGFLYLLLSGPLSAQPGTNRTNGEAISVDFPYESHYVEVLDSRMHYVDEGEGEVVLLYTATRLLRIFGEMSSPMCRTTTVPLLST